MPPIDQTQAGAQFVLPGAERISDREHAQRKIDTALRATKPQKPCDHGLFSDASAQTDLLDFAGR